MAEVDLKGDEVDVAIGDATGEPSEAAIEAAVEYRGIGIGDASLIG
jgi:hypothetical protein